MRAHALQIRVMFLANGITMLPWIGIQTLLPPLCMIECGGVGNAKIVNRREPIIVKCVKGSFGIMNIPPADRNF